MYLHRRKKKDCAWSKQAIFKHNLNFKPEIVKLYYGNYYWSKNITVIILLTKDNPWRIAIFYQEKLINDGVTKLQRNKSGTIYCEKEPTFPRLLWCTKQTCFFFSIGSLFFDIPDNQSLHKRSKTYDVNLSFDCKLIRVFLVCFHETAPNPWYS